MSNATPAHETMTEHEARKLLYELITPIESAVVCLYERNTPENLGKTDAMLLNLVDALLPILAPEA